MEEVYSSSVSAYTVQDERQAKLLSEPTSFRCFAPFLAKTCTVGRAAEEVGCNLDTMFYRVRTFLDAGLLEVVQLEKRAGRLIKHYRSTHDAYFVPLKAAPFADVEEEIRRTLRADEEVISRALARTLRSLNRQGWRIYRDKKGEVSSHSAQSQDHTIDDDLLPQLPYSDEALDAPLAEMFTSKLLLTDAEARALLSHLYQLRLDHQFEAAPSRETYLLRLIMVPLSS